MAKTVVAQFISNVRQSTLRQFRDADLLRQFVANRSNAAFEALVWRHGPMVLAASQRLLRQSHDAEDVFQATFLTLARKAASVAQGDSVRSWLYKVAVRRALELRIKQARRAQLERSVPCEPRCSVAEETDELRFVLNEELCRLPEKYRDVVVLCYLQGRTTDEAARQLGCPRGTVSTRLAWARNRLRRLRERRGFPVCGDALQPLLTLAVVVPAGLVQATVAVVGDHGIVPPNGLSYLLKIFGQGVLPMTSQGRARWVGLMVLLTVLGAGTVAILRRGAEASPPTTAVVSGSVPYALMHIRRSDPAVVRPGQTAPVDDRELEAFRKTQMLLLKSRGTHQRALEREDLARLKIVQAQPNALAWLDGVVEVEETASALPFLICGMQLRRFS